MEPKVCEVCGCTKQCNEACTAAKITNQKICDICECKETCIPACTQKKGEKQVIDDLTDSINVVTPINNEYSVTADVNEELIDEQEEIKPINNEYSVTPDANEDLTDKKEEITRDITLNDKNDQSMRLEQPKVCELCGCTGKCNDACIAAKALNPPKVCDICECDVQCIPECPRIKDIPAKEEIISSNKNNKCEELKINEITCATPIDNDEDPTAGDTGNETICEKCTCPEDACNSVCTDVKTKHPPRCDKCECTEKCIFPFCTKSQEAIITTGENDEILELQAALLCFQEKCREKDFIIDKMKDQLNKSSGSYVFQEMLTNMTNAQKEVKDYDKFNLISDLATSPNALEAIRKSTEDNIDSSALNITDIKLIPPSSAMIKWTPADNNNIIGYEICVNDNTVNTVSGKNKTCTIIEAKYFNKKPANVCIFALSGKGRCEPSATYTYN